MASLKYEANSSLQTVTLGSAYTAASGTMTLTAGHGARLPASGDYWIAYNNGSGTVRIFKVTSRSTDTLTVVADATEGSGDGNISSGETLRWALTCSALNQLRIDICSFGTYAGLPSTCKKGDQYYCSDSPYSFVATADNTWQAFLKGVAVTRPSTISWTNYNTGSATLSSSSGVEYILGASSAGQSVQGRYKSYTAPYSVKALVRIQTSISNFAQAGLMFTDGIKTAVVAFTMSGGVFSLTMDKFTNSTTYAGSSYTPSTVFSPEAFGELWIELRDDGTTNRTVKLSADNINWITVQTISRTDHLTPTAIGYFVNPNTSSTAPAISVLAWNEGV